MIFETWLKKQVKRNDPIGDLARDFSFAQKESNNEFEKCNEEHLLKWNAISGAYDALKEAQQEFERINNDR